MKTDSILLAQNKGKIFTVNVWADLSTVTAGDLCPHCGEVLEGARGIEGFAGLPAWRQVFKAIGLFIRRRWHRSTIHHGVLGGVGVTRTLAAVVEQHNDEQGYYLAILIAPLPMYHYYFDRWRQ